MKTYILILSVILVLPSTASRADVILLDSGVEALRSTTFGDATNLSVGYGFTLASTRTVLAFGLYDAANNPSTGFQGDGLLSTNDEVNLWRVSDGKLLAISLPIPLSGADAAGFIYQSLYTPFEGFDGTLVAETAYIVTARYNTVGGVSQGNNIDAFRDSNSGPRSVAGFVSSLGPGQFSGTGAFYQYPGNSGGPGFAGPNIQVMVPEPTSLALAAVGAIFGSLLLRRRTLAMCRKGRRATRSSGFCLQLAS